MMASYHQAGKSVSMAPEPYHPSNSARGPSLQTSSTVAAYAASISMANPGYKPHTYCTPLPASSLQSAKIIPGLPECPEKDVDTFIGCPIVVLLQHKDYCAVKLQAIEEGTHAIKCRNCPYQTSEPMAMLDHLADIHKRFTDTQYLCQLSSTFMGQKPVCFGVTGYDELPDGLSDFLDGIYRWDKRTQNMVMVYPCRLCPSCYLTKQDLKTHYLSHQQNLLLVNQPDAEQPMYVCRICRQEFQDFISYYDHHAWMRLPENILPPKKPRMPEITLKAVASSGEASTGDASTRGCREADSYPKQTAKQPHLNDPSQRASVRGGGIIYNPQTKLNLVGSMQVQADPLNLSMGPHRMSIVDRALTYPVYQDIGGKQLEQGIVHLCCPYCQAVYKYRHWLAMHLQNIHGVKDKRALSEALSTSYAKSAANYYTAKAQVPTKEINSTLPSSNKSSVEEVIIINSEKTAELPMPRPDPKILDALKLMPKQKPTVDQLPTPYLKPSSSSAPLKSNSNDLETKESIPQDEDEGIGEMESDGQLNSTGAPLSSPQAGKTNMSSMHQQLSVNVSDKEAKDKQQKSPRGRPKKGQRPQGKLAALCEELAKRVESQQDKDCKESPKKSEDDPTSEAKELPSIEFVTCDICAKTFKHKNQLWGHKKTHSKIYTCRAEKDATRETKTKSSRLGRRQNMPNFRDIANGKVPPVAISVKIKSRNTFGSTKGTKQNYFSGDTATLTDAKTFAIASKVDQKTQLEQKTQVDQKNQVVQKTQVDQKTQIDQKIKVSSKKKGKIAKKKSKALAELISAYQDRGSYKKKINIKEGNNAFYPRRFFSRYCLLRRQMKTRKMLGNLRKVVMLEIDADTVKNVYECIACHHYHRFHRRCLQHYQDKHLYFKKQSQKRANVISAIKKVGTDNKSAPVLVNKESSNATVTKSNIPNKSCHYCTTPGFTCTVHAPSADVSKSFVVKTDDKGHTCFSCCTCHKVFSFQSSVLRHLNSHQVNQNQNVPCPSCSFVAKSPLSLAAHSRVHKNSHSKESICIKKQITSQPQQQVAPQVNMKPKKQLQCDQCKEVYYKLTAEDHHTCKTTDKEYFPYRCNQCPAYFKQPEDMYDHIQLMHTSKNAYRCSKCSYSTASYTTLLKHEKGHEREENKATKLTTNPLFNNGVLMPPPASNSASGSFSQEKIDTGTQNLQATVSTDTASPDKGKEDGNDEKVKQPNKSPTETEIIESLSVRFEKVEVPTGSDEGWYFCTECSFTTNKQDSYSRHFKMHERAEMLTCEECDFPVYDQPGLEEHMLKAHHKNVQKLRCDMCQYITSVPERMVRHRRLHKKMTLKCDQCGYTTPEKRFMIRHILTVHEQQRPFSCEKCNYSTAYKHHLKRHYHLHKQQILQCPKCVHCTLDEKLMLQHIQTHNNDAINVKCDMCSREFVNSKSLSIHKSRDHSKHNLSVEDAINKSTPGRQYRCDVSSVTSNRETPLQLCIVSADELGSPEVYKCKVCAYTTAHQGNITLHMVQEHMEEDVQMKIEDLRNVQQCAQCGFCTTKDQLSKHMHSHEEKDIYQCKKCDFRTPHIGAYNRHICKQVNLTNIESSDIREKCDEQEKATVCMDHYENDKSSVTMTESEKTAKRIKLKMTKSAESLKNSEHFLQSENSKMSKDSSILVQPAEYNTGSTKDMENCVHLENYKPGTTLESEIVVEESNQLTPIQGADCQKGFQCPGCKRQFETEDLLKNHIKTDHTRLISAQNPFICMQCPYSSCSEKETRRHLGLHNYNQQFKCEYCVFSTTTASSIATHRKVHRTNKRHSTMSSKHKNISHRIPASLIGNYASGILVDVDGIPQRRYPCKFCGDVFHIAEEWQLHERHHLMVWNMEHTAGSK